MAAPTISVVLNPPVAGAKLQAILTPTRTLTYSASGETLASFGGTFTSTGAKTFNLPSTDSKGWVNEAGNRVEDWAYQLTGQWTANDRIWPFALFFMIPAGTANGTDIYSLPTGNAGSGVDDAGKPVFDVTSFNAQGDGVTNDTAAIQAAIYAAEANGGTVYFPAGTYVGVLPQITVGNITVRGDGAKSKILCAPAAMAPTGLTTGLWVNGAKNVTIRDLQIDGNFANVAKDGTYQSASSLWTPIISKYGAQHPKTYKMNGSGGSIDSSTYLHYRMPVRITDSDNVTVENCLIVNSVSAGILADGTAVNSCKNITVTGCRIKDTWDNGIYFHQGVQYGLAALNTISDTTYNGVSAVYCDHILVTDNNIRFAGPSDSDSGGIQINGSSNCAATNNIIDQCQFYGIDVLSTQETNITNGAGGNSVYGTNTTLANNTITNCHSNDYPTHNAPGINLFGADNTSVTGNSIDNCDFGISLGSRAIDSAIVDNRITNCSALGVNVGNSADCIGTIIKSNFIGYNKSHGIYGNAPARYEGNTIIGNIGMGINLSSAPSGMPQKTDYVIGNTIMDNTDSGMLTGGGSNCLTVIERNFFGNSLGVVFNDGVITYNSTTLTSASAAFTSADVGSPVYLINQGANDVLTTTTIASVTNATTVVLASPAQATQTGLTFSVGRGPVFFSGASTAGATLTAPSGSFVSSDNGKFITLFRAEPNLTPLFTGSISGYTSSTTVTLSGTVGTYAGVVAIVNRSAGQQARAINNYPDNVIINRNNTVYGIPELLNGGGTVNRTSSRLTNVLDPVLSSDAATKNYTDTGGWSAVPATAASAGVAGSKAYDGTYLYICTATNTWKRVAIATW